MHSTYRVVIIYPATVRRTARTKALATNKTRDQAIEVASEHHRQGARIFNEQTGDELVNGSDGRVKELPSENPPHI